MQKRFAIFMMACLLAVAALAQSSRPRVAVVLSGGGAKGMSHIGALKVIEQAGIPVDIITGTSMGSIVGGLYAIGYDADRLDSLVRQQDWTFLLSDKTSVRSPFLDERQKQHTYFLSKTVTLSGRHISSETGGFIEGKNLAVLFKRLTVGYNDSIDFGRLPIPFACVATNIVDNSEYDFHDGVLAEAMRASMSIPGAFTPVRKGDKVLVDGGLRNNFPVDIARQMGADIVIGVTVQGPPKTADDLKGGASILSQIVDVNCKNKYDENLEMTDVPIRVNTQGYSSASFNRAAIDTLIRRGEEAAMEHWDDLVALRERIGMADGEMAPRRSLHPAAIQPDTLSVPAEASRPATTAEGSLGVRFDTEEMVALQMAGLFSPKDKPWELGAVLRLGKRIMVRADLSIVPLRQRRMLLSYAFRHNDLNIYDRGKRDFNVTYNQHTVDWSLLCFNIRNFALDFGARFDYYHFRDVLQGKTISETPIRLKDEHLVRYYGRVKYNSENTWNFASRGARFEAGYDYHTDNFVGYGHHRGISDVHAMWRMAFSLNSRLSLQPMFYGRLLYGSEIPLCIRNVVGGEWFGHYLEQQMPLAGMGRVERVDKQFVALQLRLQQRIADNNYVILKTALAQHADKASILFDSGPMAGCQFAYYYDSMLGPLGATLGYTSRTKSPYLFVNLGFEF